MLNFSTYFVFENLNNIDEEKMRLIKYEKKQERINFYEKRKKSSYESQRDESTRCGADPMKSIQYEIN